MSKELATYLLPILIPVLGGLLGTLLEALGTRFKIPALVAIGQRTEGLLTDLPKVIRGSRKTAEEKTANDPPSNKTPPTGTPLVTGMLAIVAIVCAACGSAPEKTPCSPVDYAALSATCGDDELACNKAIDEREALCAERIRSGQ